MRGDGFGRVQAAKHASFRSLCHDFILFSGVWDFGGLLLGGSRVPVDSFWRVTIAGAPLKNTASALPVLLHFGQC